MDKLKIAKKIVSTIVGVGTTKIVQSIIQNNVATDDITSKVTVGAASAAIGWAASEATASYTDTKIDEIVTWWNENVTNRSEN